MILCHNSFSAKSLNASGTVGYYEVKDSRTVFIVLRRLYECVVKSTEQTCGSKKNSLLHICCTMDGKINSEIHSFGYGITTLLQERSF